MRTGSEPSTLHLQIAGLGIIVYSPFAVADIAEGDNYLENHYWRDEDVARQVMAGTIAGFCTGSPGDYEIRLSSGKPDLLLGIQYPWWIELALEVRDQTVCIRDLYDLLRWRPKCPDAQRFTFENGFYRLIIGTRNTVSGIVGDQQEIVMCFEHVDELPKVSWPGVPFLGDQQDKEQ